MKKQRPPKNRRKSIRYRAKKKARIKRRKAATPHGKRSAKDAKRSQR